MAELIWQSEPLFSRHFRVDVIGPPNRGLLTWTYQTYRAYNLDN